MAKIITVLSGKGGTGKTMMTANMAVTLAAEGKRVLIMDANFQSRGIDVALGMENRISYTMVDVLNGVCGIRDAMAHHWHYDHLCILEPPIKRVGEGIKMMEFSVLLERARKEFEYVLIDTSSASTDVSVRLGAMADQVMLVTTQDPVAVRAGYGLIKEIGERMPEPWDVRVLFNQVKISLMDEGYLTNVEEIAELYGLPVCGVIPYDDTMHVAFNNGCTVTDIQENEAGEHLNRTFHQFLLTE